MRLVMLLLAVAAPATALGAVLQHVEIPADGTPAVRLRFSAPATPQVRTLPADGASPDRVYVDFAGVRLSPGVPRLVAGRGGPLLRVRTGQFDADTTRVVVEVARGVPFHLRTATNAVTILLEPVPAEGPPLARPPAPVPDPLPPAAAAAGAMPPFSARRPAGHPDLPSLSLAALPPVPRAHDQPRAALPAALSLLANSPLPSPPPALIPDPEPAPASFEVARAETASPPVPASADGAASDAPRPVPGAAPPPSIPATAPSALPEASRSADAVIVLDAGHGGHDPGAEGIGGILEKDVALEFTRVLAERLLTRLPVSVVLTRADDSFVPLERRLALPGEDAALFVSLHANACADPSAHGLELFYGGGPIRTVGAAGAGTQAAQLGRALRRSLDAGVGGVRGTARPGDFTVLARNAVPSVLIEVGYLTHAGDAARARDPAFQRAIADALVDGIVHFLRGATSPL